MMEMDSNPITKPSKKRIILSAVFYVLAVVLLITAAACHQNISRQLEQGIPVQGNELAIVNLYLTSCAQYFAFAAAMVFCGKAASKVLAVQSDAPVQVTPYMLNPPAEAPGSTSSVKVEPEEDDTGFEAWGFREKEE